MKTLMQSVRRRFNSEARKASKEKEGAAQKAVQKLDGADFIENKELPRHRLQRRVSRSVMVAQLPSLKDVPTPTDKELMLIRKVRLCTYIFRFAPPNSKAPLDPATEKEKEVKRSTLLELVDFVTTQRQALNEVVMSEIFEMLTANLFRPLPPRAQELGSLPNPDEEEPVLDPSWPHLQIVYEFLLRLVPPNVSDAELKLLKKFITSDFVLNILELFDSEDARERDYLKTILHRIYGKFLPLRPLIRKGINNIFFKFIYDTDRHNGIAEFLEILGSIINGFALPLKEEHKEFLKTVLLPLHKATNLQAFHPQLSYCIAQFMEKDGSLAPVIVKSVLKFWPKLASRKEILFLNELEEILEHIQPTQLQEVYVPLFTQLARSMDSCHFQVAERAIYVLNNEVILRFISQNKANLMPILFDALCRNTNALAVAALSGQIPSSTESGAASAATSPIPPPTSDTEGASLASPVPTLSVSIMAEIAAATEAPASSSPSNSGSADQSTAVPSTDNPAGSTDAPPLLSAPPRTHIRAATPFPAPGALALSDLLGPATPSLASAPEVPARSDSPSQTSVSAADPPSPSLSSAVPQSADAIPPTDAALSTTDALPPSAPPAASPADSTAAPSKSVAAEAPSPSPTPAPAAAPKTVDPAMPTSNDSFHIPSEHRTALPLGLPSAPSWVVDWDARGHWNPTVAQLSADVLKLFVEMDQQLITRLNTDRGSQIQRLRDARAARAVFWKKLKSEAIAAVSAMSVPADQVERVQHEEMAPIDELEKSLDLAPPFTRPDDEP